MIFFRALPSQLSALSDVAGQGDVTGKGWKGSRGKVIDLIGLRVIGNDQKSLQDISVLFMVPIGEQGNIGLFSS